MFHSSAIQGHVVADAEMRYTPTGREVTAFRIAHNSRKRDENGNWVDGVTTFVKVELWGAKAEAVADLKKGELVMVGLNGKAPRTEAWNDQNGDAVAGMVYTARDVARMIIPTKKTTAAEE